MIAELHSVSPPEDVSIGNLSGGRFYDCRLPSKLLWGLYATVCDFHEALANDTNVDVELGQLPSDMAELFEFYRQSNHGLFLTHGDLSSLNILVQGDEVAWCFGLQNGRVVSIILGIYVCEICESSQCVLSGRD